MAPRHSGFLAEYPLICVDNFTANFPPLPPCLPTSALDDLPEGAKYHIAPHVHLLSHVHSDHLAGLGSLSRHSAPIYCSEVTRRLLLGLERIQDRTRHDAGHGPRIRPYRGLHRSEAEQRARSQAHHIRRQASLDLLHPLPYHTPTLISYNARFSVFLTLVPANHMPGSSMFLVQGPRGAVLHTGDVRAELAWLEALLARSILCRYAGGAVVSTLDAPKPLPSLSPDQIPSSSKNRFNHGRLETIYLDTERILDVHAPLSKTHAILDGLELLSLLPQGAFVFLDCWTAGYEEFMYAVYWATGAKIHVDRYKAWMLKQGEENSDCDDHVIGRKWNAAISTDAEMCSRIHACERTARCAAMTKPLIGPAPLIIEVEMAECLGETEWKQRKSALVSELRAASKNLQPWPRKLTVPLQRHSPLPELYEFVRSLKPRRVVANTGYSAHQVVCDQIAHRLDLSSQKSNDHKYADYDIYRDAWEKEADVGEAQQTDFSTLVARFRTSLRAQRADRLKTERMDADAELLDDVGEGDGSSTCDDGDDGYEADVSRPLTMASGKPALNVWDTVKGRFATANASPWVIPAMRQGITVSATTTTTIATAHVAEAKEAILTEELASRYLAYAGMYLGYRIRNPSRYAQPVAWRGFRKVMPDVARITEEALQRELGCIPPSWDQAVTLVPKTPPRTSPPGHRESARPSTPLPIFAKPNLTSTQSISPFGLPSPMPRTWTPERRLQNAPLLVSALDRDAALTKAQSWSNGSLSSATQGSEDDVEVVCVSKRLSTVFDDDEADYPSILAHLRRGRMPAVAPQLGKVTQDVGAMEGTFSEAKIQTKLAAAMLLALGLRSSRARALLKWPKELSRWPREIRFQIEDALDDLVDLLEREDHPFKRNNNGEEQMLVTLVILLRKLLDDFHQLQRRTQRGARRRKRVAFRLEENQSAAMKKRRRYAETAP